MANAADADGVRLPQWSHVLLWHHGYPFYKNGEFDELAWVSQVNKIGEQGDLHGRVASIMRVVLVNGGCCNVTLIATPL